MSPLTILTQSISLVLPDERIVESRLVHFDGALPTGRSSQTAVTFPRIPSTPEKHHPKPNHLLPHEYASVFAGPPLSSPTGNNSPNSRTTTASTNPPSVSSSSVSSSSSSSYSCDPELFVCSQVLIFGGFDAYGHSRLDDAYLLDCGEIVFVLINLCVCQPMGLSACLHILSLCVYMRLSAHLFKVMFLSNVCWSVLCSPCQRYRSLSLSLSMFLSLYIAPSVPLQCVCQTTCLHCCLSVSMSVYVSAYVCQHI